MPTSLPKRDIEEILFHTKDLWEEFRDKNIFVTGGTGFFGVWLLNTFSEANKTFNLNAKLLALSRDPNNFLEKYPNLKKDSSISFLTGNITNFEFPAGEFSHVLHLAATRARETFSQQDYLEKFDIIAGGTRRALEFAVKCQAKKFLYTSSAVFYGKQPEYLSHIPEDYMGAPNPVDLSSYSANLGISKRTAEFFCAYFGQKFGLQVKIARCFTFLGPELPLDVHYAAGNFIKDALKGGPILINSDGTARRSYMYPTDLMVWLLTILVKGETAYPYNVGSENDISIAELATAVAESVNPDIKIHIAKKPTKGAVIDKQIPSTKRAQTELGLKETVSLREIIAKTVKYYQEQQNQV